MNRVLKYQLFTLITFNPSVLLYKSVPDTNSIAIDLLQKSLTPHPQPLPASGEGRQSVALTGWGSFLFLIYARGLMSTTSHFASTQLFLLENF